MKFLRRERALHIVKRCRENINGKVKKEHVFAECGQHFQTQLKAKRSLQR